VMVPLVAAVLPVANSWAYWPTVTVASLLPGSKVLLASNLRAPAMPVVEEVETTIGWNNWILTGVGVLCSITWAAYWLPLVSLPLGSVPTKVIRVPSLIEVALDRDPVRVLLLQLLVNVRVNELFGPVSLPDAVEPVIRRASSTLTL